MRYNVRRAIEVALNEPDVRLTIEVVLNETHVWQTIEVVLNEPYAITVNQCSTSWISAVVSVRLALRGESEI